MRLARSLSLLILVVAVPLAFIAFDRHARALGWLGLAVATLGLVFWLTLSSHTRQRLPFDVEFSGGAVTYRFLLDAVGHDFRQLNSHQTYH